jgi:hypothetical protein
MQMILIKRGSFVDTIHLSVPFGSSLTVDRYRRKPVAHKQEKEVASRGKRTTVSERHDILRDDPNTVKLASGALKGSVHEVFCRCSPSRARKLEMEKEYILKNWYSHQRTCELVTKVKPGARTVNIAVQPGAKAAPKKVSTFLPSRTANKFLYPGYRQLFLHQSVFPLHLLPRLSLLPQKYSRHEK